MDEVIALAALLLALSLIGGLYRVIRADCDGGRLLATQLIGTTGIGLLLLFGSTDDSHGLIDTALVLALLAAVATVAFTRQTIGTTEQEESGHE